MVAGAAGIGVAGAGRRGAGAFSEGGMGVTVAPAGASLPAAGFLGLPLGLAGTVRRLAAVLVLLVGAAVLVGAGFFALGGLAFLGVLAAFGGAGGAGRGAQRRLSPTRELMRWERQRLRDLM